MRRLIVLFAIVNIILSGCDFFPDPPPIYDPDKAGATIVESFNITGQIKFFNYYFRDELICGYYSMALYGDKIYIHTSGKVLYVFDKNNFTKTEEINQTLGKHSSMELGGMVSTPGWWSSQRFMGDGLAIIDEGHGFLLCRNEYSYGIVYLLSIDLETGATTLVEGLEETGMEPDSSISRIGYDKENDFIWFNTYPAYASAKNIYFFDYDLLEGIFLLKSKIELFQSKSMRRANIFISGDSLFYTGYDELGPHGNTITNIGVEKYLVSNPEERLYFIDAEYLGTTTIPQNIIYDEPYIWMMVERDNQIQMLKLLPNE